MAKKSELNVVKGQIIEEIQIIGESFNRLGVLLESFIATGEVVAPKDEEKEEVAAPSKKAAGKKAASKKAPKVIEPEVDEDEEEEEEEEEQGNVIEWDGEMLDLDDKKVKAAKLKEILDELGVDYPSKAAKAKYIDLILANINNEVEEPEEEEEEEEEVEAESATAITYEDEDGEEVTVELSDLNAKELKKLAKELEIDVVSKKAADLMEEILEAFYADDEDEEEDDEEEEEEIDYAEELGLNDMDVEELAELCEEYELSTKGKKQALISRIVDAIESGEIELDEEGE